MIVSCVTLKKFFYSAIKINNGKSVFYPGEQVFIFKDEFIRLKSKGVVDFPKLDNSSKKRIINMDNYNSYSLKYETHFPIVPKENSNVWVIGDGPTAPLYNKLKRDDDITFGVNHCFYPKLELSPTYYVALDDFMLRKETKKIKELESVSKFTKRGNSLVQKLDWPELITFTILGESGFSDELGKLYHGKTSIYCALQLAYQLINNSPYRETIKINLIGIDLMNLVVDNEVRSHHYGHGSYVETLYPRMLNNLRFGLNFLNENQIKWKNHSDLLRSRIEDLEV